jgi:hypothetical protein
MTSGLTDDGAQLGEALKGVRAFALQELRGDEAKTIAELIGAVDALMLRGHS